MLNTKNIISNIYDVPDTWIYEYYLDLPVRLEGQDVKMRSIFNEKDKYPSLFIYFNKKNKYRFKDYSAGKGGDSIELVREIYGLNHRAEAAAIIIDDYMKYLETNERRVVKVIPHARYILESYGVRKWKARDIEYWGEFHITQSNLERFMVKPLAYIIIMREDGVNKRIIRDNHMYGYFKKDGTLYKVYRPKDTNNKFFKVKDWIHGWDQLTFKKPYLCIVSSMKDMLAFLSLKLTNIELIAPESENTMIEERLIKGLMERYEAITTLLDPDKAGYDGMAKYEETYGIPPTKLEVEEDLAECIRVHNPINTQEILYPLLTKSLTGVARQLPMT